MSYVVFARKYRPMLFADVVGQEHITNTIKKSIMNDKLAHSYIFAGTRGVGKTTTARILARALNCENLNGTGQDARATESDARTFEPCGDCASCKSAISGSNFNIVEFDAASNSGVADIRELMESVNYVPAGGEGRYRVFLIDEAHSLSKQAWNSLLKTLEEPPKNVLFIFATTEVDKILPTILSRSIRFDFKPVSEDAICRLLMKICDEEGVSYENEVEGMLPYPLLTIARRGGGSVRDSLSILERVRAYGDGNITRKLVAEVLMIVPGDVFGQIVLLGYEKKTREVLDIFEKSLADGYDVDEFLDGFLSYLRDVLLSGKVKNIGDILRMAEMVANAQREMKYSSFRRFVVERLLIKISNLDKLVTLEDLIDKTSLLVEKFEGKVSNSGITVSYGRTGNVGRNAKNG